MFQDLLRCATLTKVCAPDILFFVHRPQTFILGVFLLVLFSWALLLPVAAFDLFVVHNPRQAEPLHLFFVWALAGVFFWIIAPAASAPLLGGFLALIAGATSNLSYRLLFGPVPDYLPFPFGAWGNVADVFILVGGPVFFFFLVREVLRARRAQQEQESY
jgi:hypothetical protein